MGVIEGLSILVNNAISAFCEGIRVNKSMIAVVDSYILLPNL